MSLQTKTYFEIGPNVRVAPDVILGKRYPSGSHPLSIGDHAIIRSGSMIFSDTVFNSCINKANS